jgi:hypothetical protein
VDRPADIALFSEYDDGMRVLFVSPNTERLNMPVLPLGLALVAAAARRAGHQTRFLDLLGVPDLVAAVRQAITQFQPGEVREISQRLAAHGIRRMGFLLLGGPDETKESVDESLAFAWSLGLEMLKVSVGIRLYPHTPLAQQAVEEGIVSPEDDLLVPRFYIRPGLEEHIRQAQGEM